MGDVVKLRVGDKVPVDMRVLQLISSTLRVEQGSLTGETSSVNKSSHRIQAWPPRSATSAPSASSPAPAWPPRSARSTRR
ncbi:hypothetical protein QYE76_019923 [Lolium multiflorum]|uniref:P-type ATPase A domain-containing protein n=1 Tax=Lolium multiflorum TaxID=4521 RepID=A0AAD8VQU7_LOLMU|nr:hypothetical protein QYE76_019923 [Lolium multiflorum]